MGQRARECWPRWCPGGRSRHTPCPSRRNRSNAWTCGVSRMCWEGGSALRSQLGDWALLPRQLFLELLGKPQTTERRSRENNPFCKGIRRRRGKKRKKKKENSIANGTQCKTKRTVSGCSDRLWLFEISAQSSASGPFAGAKASRAAREAALEDSGADCVRLSAPVLERVWLGQLSAGFLYWTPIEWG